MSEPVPGDLNWMRRAVRLARKGVGFTAPNPAVGALIVSETGEILGQGWHKKAGDPHAEIEAFRDAASRGVSVRGATLYVTLEPCCTHGRTPPCTEALVREGIARVVVGTDDPNPAHAGRAYPILRSRGVEVTSGVLESECRHLIRGFARWMTTGLPWVIAKSAMSLDGRIVPPVGRQVTGPAAVRKAHEYRLLSDAIVVGAETVRTDDPSLTVRLGKKSAGKCQPWRVILTRSGNLPAGCRLLTDQWSDRTMIHQGSPGDLLKQLGDRGLQTVLLEGGGRMCASFFEQGLVDEIAFFVAPKIFGGPHLALNTQRVLESLHAVKDLKCEKLGADLLLSGYVHRTR